MRASKIYYVGMINTESYAKIIGEAAFSGAASRKMVTVARAMRSVGHRASVVSLPFVGVDAHRSFFKSVVTVENGLPVVFVPTFRSRYLRKIFGPVFLAAFFIGRVRRGDTVILYNHAVEYFLALGLLRISGVKVVQDIEDVPTSDERGIRGFLNSIGYSITSVLTAKKKMVVAEHVAKYLGLNDYVVVQGVAVEDSGVGLHFETARWESLAVGDDLRLHYGGTLLPETGVDLFCDAVLELVQRESALKRPVTFVVTGIGEMGKIRVLRDRVQQSQDVRIELRPELSKSDYNTLLRSCHGSLSLRRPDAEMSIKTFPSKVIEITTFGLALISTRIGDVSSIFDDDSAFFLSEFKAECLVDTIVAMSSDAPRVRCVALAGHSICNRTFSPESVGRKMTELL